MVTQVELYRLGLSLEITTLILSQTDWGVLAQSIPMMCAWAARVRGIGLYRVRHVPSLPSNEPFNYKVNDGYYYNGKRSSIMAN
jgi:hypothetical protein